MRWLVITFAILLGNVCWAGSRGYLCVAGPAPTHLLEESVPTSGFVLPPLAMTDASSTPAPHLPEIAAPQQPAPADQASGSSQDKPLDAVASQDSTPSQAQPDRSRAVDPAQPQNPTTVLTPQMFLRYFQPKGSDSGKEAIVVAPPGFIPPQPAASGVRSTATYTSPAP